MQSNGGCSDCPSDAPRYPSADEYPRQPYPSEDSDSTRATRKESSSSITAISRRPATQHPYPGSTEKAGHHNRCMQLRCSEIIQECYSHPAPTKSGTETTRRKKEASWVICSPLQVRHLTQHHTIS